jgi:hypothetical protein
VACDICAQSLPSRGSKLPRHPHEGGDLTYRRGKGEASAPPGGPDPSPTPGVPALRERGKVPQGQWSPKSRRWWAFPASCPADVEGMPGKGRRGSMAETGHPEPPSVEPGAWGATKAMPGEERQRMVPCRRRGRPLKGRRGRLPGESPLGDRQVSWIAPSHRQRPNGRPGIPRPGKGTGKELAGACGSSR